MSNKVNVWMALSAQAITEFKAKRSQGDDYTGTMDDETFRILQLMSDTDVVQGMFNSPTFGEKTYSLFSLYIPGTSEVKNALDYLEEKWPGHIVVIGAWWFDGRQAGMTFVYGEVEQDVIGEITPGEYDPETGEEITPPVQGIIGTEMVMQITGVEGDPLYPIHTQAYKLMPDTVTYDGGGVEIGRVPASSNSDLRDINLLAGQSPRSFN